jgi:putative oxidoreductase
MPDVTAVNLALFALRAVVGVVMLAHGINHIFGGGKIEGTGRWFESLGMRPGKLHAWFASATEVGAGALLIMGLITPLAGAGVIGVMVVAWVTNHRTNGFFIFRPGEGYEYVMVLTFLGAIIGTLGPGHWSIDVGASLWVPSALTGLLVSVIAGVGGAAGLLVTFWRPASVDKSR